MMIFVLIPVIWHGKREHLPEHIRERIPLEIKKYKKELINDDADELIDLEEELHEILYENFRFIEDKNIKEWCQEIPEPNDEDVWNWVIEHIEYRKSLESPFPGLKKTNVKI